MNRYVFVGLLLGMSFAYADTNTTQNFKIGMTADEVSKLSPDQRATRLRQAQQFLYKRTGGMVKKIDSSKGSIHFINAQRRIPIEDLSSPVDFLSARLRLPALIKNGKCDGYPNDKMLKDLGVNFAVFILDNSSIETPMLVAPESRWAIVNVDALAKESVEQKQLANRVRVEMSRAFCFLCGCASSKFESSVTGALPNIKSLDKFGFYDSVPADQMQRVIDYLKWYGVRPYVEATYRAACLSGWAPKPKDEVQQAIWDEVHAAPTAPIVIKPEAVQQK